MTDDELTTLLGKRIYIAGPFTCGSEIRNMRNAILIASTLRDVGFIPYVPHTSGLEDMLFPQSYETWMRECLSHLATCHAMVRLPGHSPGADREEDLANKLGIPVLTVNAQLVTNLREALGIVPGV